MRTKSRSASKITVVLIGAALVLSSRAQASVQVKNEKRGASHYREALFQMNPQLIGKYQDQVAFGPYIIFFG